MTAAQAKTSPGSILTEAATKYAAAKAGEMVTNFGNRAAGTGSKPDDGEDRQGFIGKAAEKIGEGASPAKAAIAGVGTSIKEGVTNLFKGKGKSKRPNNIVEDCYVGVPVDQAFAAWTDYEEWSKFSKGIENVNRKPADDDDEDAIEETDWSAKVFLSRRSWHATTTAFDPPNRIAWQSEGAKGTIEGTVTFTPVGENATLILVVMEYRNKGPIEWIANRWRAAERRAKLDIKHFRRYVMRAEPDELPEAKDEPGPSDEATGAEEPPEESTSEESSEEPTDTEEDDKPTKAARPPRRSRERTPASA
jgi:uncharacterized membrane protein